MKLIKIKNAKENNLKSISLEIPRDKFVVFSGISGSGKSSLAFDTIYAEGQRRYMESLSSYARQFLGQMEKPNVESIEGLSPAISIDQKTTSKNPRSIVGTVTEIYDYLRLLFARIGTPFCPNCGKEIKRTTVDQVVDTVMRIKEGERIQVLAPVVRGRKGEYIKLFEQYKKSGYVRVIVDGISHTLDEDIPLDKNIKHSISVVIDRLVVKQDIVTRLTDSVETALKLAAGLVVIKTEESEELYSDKYSCPDCGITLEELEPRMMSFNSPFGACPDCTGLGFKQSFSIDLMVSDRTKSIANGAIKVMGFNFDMSGWLMSKVKELSLRHGFSIYEPFEKLSDEAVDVIFNGEHFDSDFSYMGKPWEGIIPVLHRRYLQASGDYVRHMYEDMMVEKDCPTCHGQRLKREVLSIKIAGLNIYELCQKSIEDTLVFFNELKLDETKGKIAYMVIKEIKARLKFLIDVGLGYLTLWRPSATLSGGEAQRIRLATQIGSGLTGVLYVLDEPSIGLHQRDNEKLINTLKELKDLGNTLIVVEHDEDTIRSAEHVVDIGVGAGVHGGEVIAQGSVEDIIACEESLTGQYLSGKRRIPIPAFRRASTGTLTVKGAHKNNLKNLTVDIPLGVLNVVTGVSGSGKSSLINEVLMPFLAHKLNRASKTEVECDEIENWEALDKVISIDQSAIGKTPRSNPATYTGVFNSIRELFAATPDAKQRGYKLGRFSFNIKGGRCENCFGDGILKIAMNFLPDVYVPCPVCHGKRYNRETLEVKYKGKTISDVLDMTVEEACHFFENITKIKTKIQTLFDVGLGYIKLGQSATTLSGGEAQRVKLATELSRRSTGKTIYILDEPTTGLHPFDVEKLIAILQRFVQAGNTVVVIEHNMDVIKVADHIIDLGKEGGDKGGEIVAVGTPEEIVKIKESATGQWLKKYLEKKE